MLPSSAGSISKKLQIKNNLTPTSTGVDFYKLSTNPQAWRTKPSTDSCR